MIVFTVSILGTLTSMLLNEIHRYLCCVVSILSGTSAGHLLPAFGGVLSFRR